MSVVFRAVGALKRVPLQRTYLFQRVVATPRPLGNDSYARCMSNNAVSNPMARVYVMNIPWQATREEVQHFMQQAGEVARAEVLITPDGRSKGAAVVEYANPEDADRAVRDLSMQEFQGRPLYVRPDREASTPYGRTEALLYVGNVPAGFRWQELKDLFRDYGVVSRSEVQMDEMGNRWGVVTFTDAMAAQKAIEGLNGWNGGGRDAKNLVVTAWAERPEGISRSTALEPNRRRGSQAPNPQVIVRNLPWQTDSTDLIQLFESGGAEVVQAEVLYAMGRSRGVGVVEFRNAEAAQQAILAYDNYMYGGRAIAVTFAGNPHNFSRDAMGGIVKAKLDR